MNYYKKIENDLMLISSLAGNKYKNDIISIYLEGSYGRGEGAFLKKNDFYYPINDYDILIITKTNNNQTIQSDFKSLVTKMLISRLDVTVINIKSFLKQKFTLIRYDLLNNSFLVYGDSNTLKLVDNFNQNKIPFREKEQLFFSRFISFLLFKFQKNRDVFFNIQQLSKSVVSSYEALLLQMHIYTSSYKENRKTLKNLKCFSSDEKKIINFFYEVKLNPTTVDFSIINEEELFYKSYCFVKSCFFRLISNHNPLFKYKTIYMFYFWIRPRRFIQILFSLFGNKSFLKELLLIFIQIRLFLYNFNLNRLEITQRIFEILFKKKFQNKNEFIDFVIKKRMGWE